MFDNYNNEDFNNNLFNTNNEYKGNNENLNSGEYDVPPKLDPIKNLSEATNSVAPTMDVLSPMNIMPESFAPSQDKQDRLDDYENGTSFQSIHFQQENNPTQINNSMPNESSLEQNSSISFDFVNGREASLISPAMQNENSNLVQEQQDNIPNVTENILGQNNNLSLNITNNKNVDATTSIMERQISNINQEIENTDGLNNVPLTNSFTSESDFSSINFEMDKELDNSNSNANLDTDVEIRTSENELKKEDSPNQTEDYTILQENIEEPQLDLGISNEFDNDFDTLDILDIEDSPLDDDKSAEAKVDNAQPVIINVEKIKELISEIKNTGVEISFEEFDFENMYQLIIKINK